MDKLISMTDFVKMQWKKEIKLEQESTQSWHNCKKYSEFISQPLTLGMFVYCDLDGNVLEEPDLSCKRPESKGNCQCGEESVKDCREWWNEYQEAKERVLFKGFELISTTYSDTVSNGIINYDLKQCKELKITIDCLVNDNLVLNESAKKQIFGS